mgnify:CR=1 FL=1
MAVLYILLALIFLTPLAGADAAPGSRYVWWEAENPQNTDFAPLPSDPRDVKEVASRGKWLGANEGSFAEYEIEVPAAAEWTLHARMFGARHGSLRWRFDGSPWQYILRFKFRGARLPVPWLETDEDWIEAGNRISQPLQMDHTPMGSPHYLNWVGLGKVHLSGGRHLLRIELDDSGRPRAFDAFVLTRGRFYPRGKFKPDEPVPEEEGWWAFYPHAGGTAEPMLDLREVLNEPYAGSKGFVRRDGEAFVHSETGEPVRFWGTHVHSLQMPPDLLEEQARFFAEHGVNLIRIFPFHWRNRGRETLEVDPVKVRRFQRLVEVFKRHGIYTTIAIYSGRCVYDLEQVPGFEAFKSGEDPWLMHLIHPKFEEAYRGWLKGLLAAENPVSGVPLAREPALLAIELQNEANVLWWAFQEKKYPAEMWDMVEARYREWLTREYGSLDGALTAWGVGGPVNRERLMLPPWHMLTKRSRRVTDQVHFLADLERTFYLNTKRYLKDEIGFEGLVLASNWETIQDIVLGGALAWIESPSDFHDHHYYFHAPSKKLEVEGRKVPHFHSRSGLRWEGPEVGQKAVCCGFLDVIRDDKPSMTSEYGWRGESRWHAEFPLFVAAQARCGGMDAMVNFAAAPVPGWTGNEVGWSLQSPAFFGQYPAAALLFRTDALDQGKVLAHMRVNREEALDLEARQLVTKTERSGLNLEAEIKKDPAEGRIIENRGVYLSAGRARLDVGDFPSSNQIESLDPWWDPAKKVIRHSNGQIRWNSGAGLYTVDAAQANAAVGFLGEQDPITLSSMRVETDLPFGAVCLISLDGRPLSRSGRMLLQVMSEQKEHGERFSEPDPEGWLRVLQPGTSPYMVRNLDGTVELLFEGAGGCRITPLSPDFRASGDAVRGPHIEMARDILYYLIER